MAVRIFFIAYRKYEQSRELPEIPVLLTGDETLYEIFRRNGRRAGINSLFC